MLSCEHIPGPCAGLHVHGDEHSPRQDLTKLPGKLRPGIIPHKQEEPGHSVSKERNLG